MYVSYKRQVVIPKELKRIYMARQKTKKIRDCFIYLKLIPKGAVLTDMPAEEDYSRYNLVNLDEMGRFVLPYMPNNERVIFVGQGNKVKIRDAPKERR
jgi:hypothetical protein